MQNKDILLTRIFLKSTSQLNAYRHCTDPKRKNRIFGNMVGFSILFVLLVVYSMSMGIGYGYIGFGKAIPVICAASISLLSFVMTLFKVDGYLFAFKEYDMIMALPFEVNTIVRAKFMHMFIKSLKWYCAISIPMLIGYACYENAALYVYPVWIILSVLLPVIPSIFAVFVGFILAKVGSIFKKTKIVQTILTIILVIAAFASRFLIEELFKDGRMGSTLSDVYNAIDNTGNIYIPIKWFGDAINNAGISDMLLFVGVSLIVLEVVILVIGHSYRKLNSKLKSNAEHKTFTMSAQKTRSAVRSIAFKELKRFTGSNVYMVNMIIGAVLAVIVGIVALFFGLDKIIDVATQNSPLTVEMVLPGIPFIVHFMVGMTATTACTPSLEGKNYWIIQSLPIEKAVLHKGKILFNLCLAVPAAVISTMCLCISARASIIDSIMYLIIAVELCIFSSCLGLIIGLKHIKLDWENDVEVVKQGAAVTLYMLPNLFATIFLVVAVVALGNVINPRIVTVMAMLLMGALAALLYVKTCVKPKE